MRQRAVCLAFELPESVVPQAEHHVGQHQGNVKQNGASCSALRDFKKRYLCLSHRFESVSGWQVFLVCHFVMFLFEKTRS